MEREQTEHLNNVEQLINELKALKVQELVLLTKLETATKKRDTVPTTERPASEAGFVYGNIVIGDRVRIKKRNKVRKPATWTSQVAWSAEKERTATVTRVTPTQVHFITDNGVETWRAPNNLDKI